MITLVVEARTMIRELLALACAQARPFDAIVAAGSPGAALEACGQGPVGLVVIDLGLAEGDPVEFVERILSLHPSARVVAIADGADEFTLHRALDSRIGAVVDKADSLHALQEAIEAVIQGRRFVSATVSRLQASVRADPVALGKVLSSREQEVLRLAGRGLSNDQVAGHLRISVRTAKHHRTNLMAKLGIHTTRELIRYAFDKGLARRGEPANLQSERTG